MISVTMVLWKECSISSKFQEQKHNKRRQAQTFLGWMCSLASSLTLGSLQVKNLFQSLEFRYSLVFPEQTCNNTSIVKSVSRRSVTPKEYNKNKAQHSASTPSSAMHVLYWEPEKFIVRGVRDSRAFSLIKRIFRVSMNKKGASLFFCVFLSTLKMPFDEGKSAHRYRGLSKGGGGVTEARGFHSAVRASERYNVGPQWCLDTRTVTRVRHHPLC